MADMRYGRILIVMAMRAEAEPLARRLGLTATPLKFGKMPTLSFNGTFRSAEILMLVNGVDAASGMDMICTQPASVATTLGVQNFKPDLILNFGTCGALGGKGFRIGDLVLACDRIWFHARRIPLPGWESYGLGGHPTAGTPELATALGFKNGTLSTADSLDFPALDAAVFERVGGDIADMEGAAIAWLAALHAIPFFVLKGVTDLIDANRKTGEQFQENLATVVEAIADGAVRLLERIAAPR